MLQKTKAYMMTIKLGEFWIADLKRHGFAFFGAEVTQEGEKGVDLGNQLKDGVSNSVAQAFSIRRAEGVGGEGRQNGLRGAIAVWF
jgi:hypothetical protein